MFFGPATPLLYERGTIKWRLPDYLVGGDYSAHAYTDDAAEAGQSLGTGETRRQGKFYVFVMIDLRRFVQYLVKGNVCTVLLWKR